MTTNHEFYYFKLTKSSNTKNYLKAKNPIVEKAKLNIPTLARYAYKFDPYFNNFSYNTLLTA